MISHDDSAIVFQDVHKTYKLYQSKWQMARDAMGFKNKRVIPEFYALKNINLTIKKGERIGIIGRNGAGKSTLLKLITGNFTPSSGHLQVHGKIQALMNMGTGFHPEFTGYENIKASLLYNGLEQEQFDQAVADIIEFVELGDFLNQPLKTYSLGMQTRLYFAVATAVQPEILIVDEVLSAGDAYFSAKSAERMRKLTSGGCTLLLVSHSTAQVLQFCEKAVWIECGELVMEGNAIDVVKAYEEYSRKLEHEAAARAPAQTQAGHSVIQSKWLRDKLLSDVLAHHHPDGANGQDANVSRWPAQEEGLKIEHISLLNASGHIVSRVSSGETLTIDIRIRAEKPGDYDVYFVILLFTGDGRWLTRHCSEKVHLTLAEGAHHSAQLQYDKVLLGAGKYIFSAAIYKTLDLNDLENARYYDLLSRSFQFEVEGLHNNDNTLFHHPATWQQNHNPVLSRVGDEQREELEV